MTLNFVIPQFELGGSANTPLPLQFYQRSFRLGGGTGAPTWQDIVIKGIGSLTLLNAKADSLEYLKLFGKSQLEKTVPNGYTRTISTANDATAASKIDTGLMPQDGDVIEVRFKSGTAGVSFYCFQARSGSGKPIYGISGSSSGGTISADWSSSLTSNIARTEGHEYFVRVSFVNGVKTIYVKDITANTDDTQTGTYNPETQIPESNYYLWGNTPQYLNRTYPMFEVKLTNNGVTRLHYIPCKQDSDSVAGFYNLATNSFVTTETNVLTAGAETPTPTNPLNILCNNGDITVSPNLFRTVGTTTTQGGVTFAVQSDGSVVCSGRATAYYSYYLGRADFDPSTIDKITVAINGTLNASGNIVVDKFHVYSGSTSLGTISYTNWTQSLTVDIANDYPTADNIRVYIKRNSNTDTDTIIKPMAVKGTVNKAWKPYGEIYITGTTETITDEEGNTATAENLLGVGDVADTQEILSGTVTRKVGVLALTGTESWSGNSSNSYFSLAKSAISPSPIATSYAPLCTHLVGANTYESVAGTIFFGTSYLNVNYNNEGGGSSSTARANFNNWLKSQYANGTPVIVVYPLATETTETVTGQTMNINSGTNTIEIIQSSLDDLGLEAKYKGGVSVTVTELEEANIDNEVTVTIGE